VYVHPDAQRRGITRRLYGTLLDTLQRQGLHQAVGVITLPGSTSVAAHEAMGFTPAGVWRQAGYKLGQWWDVGVWQKTLSEPRNPPTPLIPFGELRATDAWRQLNDTL
jgi:phosphinothricin acetyltransferase